MFAQKHCEKIEINCSNVFFPIAGLILVFFTVFVLAESLLRWNQKEIQISEKSQL